MIVFHVKFYILSSVEVCTTILDRDILTQNYEICCLMK